jgi:hypothetical protein
MDCEHERFPQRLKHIDAQTTNLGTGRLIDPKQRIAKCLFFSRQRLEADNKVKRQATPPANKYATRNQHPSKRIAWGQVFLLPRGPARPDNPPKTP